MRGLTTQHSQELDSAFSPELTEHLFQQQGESFGLDLVSSSYCSYYSDKCNSVDLMLTLGEPQHPARAGPRPGAIQQLADSVRTAEVGQSIVKNHTGACAVCCRVESWKMLSQEFPTMNVARLQALYSSVDDIDVFIGGILEPAVNGSLLGPTFLCIIGDQFQRIRCGTKPSLTFLCNL